MSACTSLLLVLTSTPSKAQVFDQVVVFQSGASSPGDALALGIDGNFYGTTILSGSYGHGTIFRMTPGGLLTTVVEFDGASTGSYPNDSMIQTTDGTFYGTTNREGAGGHGTVFRLTPGGELTTLVAFTGTGGENPGSSPGSMIQGADGNFYGTTRAIDGVEGEYGTLFRMTPNGELTTLVAFTGAEGAFGGASPNSIIQGSDGNFYGTTGGGGYWDEDLQDWVSIFATVFKLTPAGEFETLTEFAYDELSGLYPNGNGAASDLVQSGDGSFAGHLFGTTSRGGLHDCGTVFRISPEGVLTTLVHFTGRNGNAKGANPTGTLVTGADGNFYGITEGGDYWDVDLEEWVTSPGTVFKITPAGELTILVEFTGIDGPNKGRFPDGRLTLGTDGNFYGATDLGGADDLGTIYRMTPEGELTTLVEFTGMDGAVLGSYPSTPIQHPDGNFYGTTGLGGRDNFGTMYRMSSVGGLTTLNEIIQPSDASRGRSPIAPLVKGEDGNFYGTTWIGGYQEYGSAFRLSPGGELTHLADFDGSSGWGPSSALVQDNNGNFYGTDDEQSGNETGTVFRMAPDGTLTDFGIYGAPPTKGPDGSIYFLTYGTVYRLSPEGDLAIWAEIDGGGGGGAPVFFDGHLYATNWFGGDLENGTVFKISPSGMVTTLVEFAGGVGGSRGSAPNGLIVGTDGNFYGTTQGGGEYWNGTIFRLTPEGELTVLYDFDDLGGVYPTGTLIEADDGFLYGTTKGGGSEGYGTVFRVSLGGDVETVLEFNGSNGARPRSGLIPDGEGNLYGTTEGGGPDDRGTIYRLLFPGKPLLSLLSPALRGDSVAVQARANARGQTTNVVFEYGTDSEILPHSFTLLHSLPGFENRLVTASLGGLPPGTTYYYRFRASNSQGETITPVQSFTTLAPPLTSVTSATEILPTSARLNGTVDARNHESSVRFEWGTDGNTFPNSIAATPSTVTGTGQAPVFAPFAGLTKGTTYHYRVVATNAGGTTVSGTQSFRTLTEPVPTIGGSFALSTTSARVEGAVDPQGSDTTVLFEYGTDGTTFPNSVSAAQGTQSGSGSRAVSAVLTNLQQGVTYHYRLRATSDGGVGMSQSNTFSMNVLSGFARVFPGAPPEAAGFLLVNLAPSGLLHGWRFVGETRWRSSGVVASGLTSGDRLVEFRPVPGYISPPTDLVSLTSGGAATILDRTYFETESDGSGGLTVTLKPDSITSGPNRAQWRLLGEDDNAWRDSGANVSALPPGDYVVECKPVPGRATPRESGVIVTAGQTTSRTLAYFEAGSFPGELPVPLAFETVSREPYAHLGQLRSSVGSGSGFVVKERVVATAAHVVWDEGSLSAAPGLQWLHQRHAGTYEPQPLEPRGFYLLSGYADQRTVEGTPGSFSPESRNRDVAALYFNAPAARGGYGGFLASDLDSNEFLLSNANKILAGYPLDGIAPTSQGRLFATPPSNVPFTPVGAAANRTFLTTAVRSGAGTSGGPLLVQFEGGAYYPAAIYLGGVEQSVVRALDSAALDLFERAELSGIDGEPHVGGGITHTFTTPLPGESDRGALRVLIQPAGAVAAGALWRLRGEDSYRASGAQRAELKVATYRLELATIPGWLPPAVQNVNVLADQLRTVTFTYERPPVPEIAVSGNGLPIANGDSTPSALDHTDFGIVEVTSGSSTRTYTIANPGNAALSLGNVTFGGAHPGDFSVSVPPGSSVPPGGSTSFTVAFDPSAPGTRFATVSFANNVAGKTPLSFAIRGNAAIDSDGNGFSDVEEADLSTLLSRLVAGRAVNLDLGFLELGDPHQLAVSGLPPGLSFDPATGRIMGTPAAGAGAFDLIIQKREDDTVLGEFAVTMRVVIPARVTVTLPRRFPATKVGRRSRPRTLTITNTGGEPLLRLAARATGKAARDFLVSRPPATLGAAASTRLTATFKPRAKGRRSASLTITSNVAPRALPLIGSGR